MPKRNVKKLSTISLKKLSKNGKDNNRKNAEYFCDVCGAEDPEYINKCLQVIIPANNMNPKPYLSIRKMDICHECFDKILNGKAVYGDEDNNYYFRKTKIEA